MALDLAVPALEQQRRVDRGARARELHDAADTGRLRGVDRRALVLDLVADVGARQEEPLDSVERPLERVAVGEVADGELDVVAEHARGLLAVADERAWLDAALAQLAHDVSADGAGRSCHQCSHRVAPLLGGMLALRRNTFAGS